MKKTMLIVIFFAAKFAVIPTRVAEPEPIKSIFVSVTDSLVEGSFGFVRAVSFFPIEDTLRVILSFNPKDTFFLSPIDSFSQFKKIPSPLDFKPDYFSVKVLSNENCKIFNVKIIKDFFPETNWSVRRSKQKLAQNQKIDSVKILLNSFAPDKNPFVGKIGDPICGDLIVTEGFGTKRITGDKYRVHRGIDYRASVGTSVYSTAKGKVRIARFSSHFGNTIMIGHGGDVETIYLHLSKFLVNEGDSVEFGDLIGYSGATGHVTGPHLHYGVRLCKTPISPEGFKSAFN